MSDEDFLKSATAVVQSTDEGEEEAEEEEDQDELDAEYGSEEDGYAFEKDAGQLDNKQSKAKAAKT